MMRIPRVPIHAAIVLFLLMLMIAAAHAAPVAGLAVVCEDTAAEGKSLDQCADGRAVYRTPAATDLVRDCGTDAVCWTAGDVWRKFSAVAVGSTYDTCTTAINENTRSPNPWTAAADPCKAWATKLKAAPVSTTGTINLSWDPTLLCVDDTDGLQKACNDPAHPDWAIRGYRVVSGASSTAMTLLQSTGPGVVQLSLPGYSNGTYYFAVSAFNADPKAPESGPSATLQVIVAKPVQPAASGKPLAPGATRATVTYP